MLTVTTHIEDSVTDRKYDGLEEDECFFPVYNMIDTECNGLMMSTSELITECNGLMSTSELGPRSASMSVR
jgi:reverse gyrase